MWEYYDPHEFSEAKDRHCDRVLENRLSQKQNVDQAAARRSQTQDGQPWYLNCPEVISHRTETSRIYTTVSRKWKDFRAPIGRQSHETGCRQKPPHGPRSESSIQRSILTNHRGRHNAGVYRADSFDSSLCIHFPRFQLSLTCLQHLTEAHLPGPLLILPSQTRFTY